MEHKGTKTIETHRLLLRKFCAEDINAAYMNWTSDDRVTEFLRWPTHTSKKITETVIKGWIKESEKPEFYQWAIVLKDINEPIGTISVVDKNDDLNILHIDHGGGRHEPGQDHQDRAGCGVSVLLRSGPIPKTHRGAYPQGVGGDRRKHHPRV